MTHFWTSMAVAAWLTTTPLGLSATGSYVAAAVAVAVLSAQLTSMQATLASSITAVGTSLQSAITASQTAVTGAISSAQTAIAGAITSATSSTQTTVNSARDAILTPVNQMEGQISTISGTDLSNIQTYEYVILAIAILTLLAAIALIFMKRK